MTTIDELKDFFNKIDNLISKSNIVKLEGLDKLNEINNFLILYFIDKYNLIDDFDYFYKIYATKKIITDDYKIINFTDKKCYKLWNEIYNITNKNCLLIKMSNHKIINKYIYNDVNKISAYINKPKIACLIQEIFYMFYQTFKYINFNNDFYINIGFVYEEYKLKIYKKYINNVSYHITPNELKQLIIEELEPNYNDKVYDPSGGSIGFIHSLCVYVKNKYTNGEYEIFKKNIYTNDITSNITKSLMTNLLLHNISIKNIKNEIPLYENKFDVCLNIRFNSKLILNNDIEYYEPIIYNDNLINDIDIQYMYYMSKVLKENGIGSIVIKQNYLSKKTNSHVMFNEWFLNNNYLYKIILLPKNIFNNDYETIVLFFIKGLQTKKIKYYKAEYENIKNKSGLKYDKNNILTILNYNDIKNNNWSLNITIKKDTENYKNNYIKLGDICNFDIKSKRNDSDCNEFGKYLYFSGCKILKTDYNDYTTESIIFGSRGKHNIFFSNNFSCSNTNIIINIKSNEYLLKYIYYYLLLNNKTNNLEPSNINKIYISNIDIPEISLDQQKQIILLLDEKLKLTNINNLIEYIKNVSFFNLLLNNQYVDTSNLLYLIYRKIEIDNNINLYESDKKSFFNFDMNNTKYKKYKLNDLAIFKNGDLNTKDIDNIGKYPYYNTSVINPSGTHSEYTIDEKEYIIFIRNSSSNNTLGKSYYVSGKSAIMKSNLIILPYNDIIIFKFLYYYLEFNREYFINNNNICINGFIKISMESIKDCLIKIPSMEDQTFIIEQIEFIENEQNNSKKYGEIIMKKINDMFNIVNNIKFQSDQDIKNTLINNINNIDKNKLKQIMEIINQ